MTDNVGPKVFLVGPSGSGKSVVGHLVAERLGWPFHDTDSEILKHTNKLSVREIFDEEGEPQFRRLEVGRIKEIELESSPSIVSTGGGLPIIAGMMHRLSRIGLTIYLEACEAELWRRIVSDKSNFINRPLLASGGLETLRLQLSERREIYNMAGITLNTEMESPLRVSDEVINIIADIKGKT